MAKDTDNPFEDANASAEAPSGAGKKLAIRVGLMVAVLGVGSAGGYTLGGLFAKGASPDPNDQPDEAGAFEEDFPASPAGGDEEFQYVDFEPIIANLNLPRLERYIRATLTLAIRKKNSEVALPKIEKKKAELRSQLTGYLSGQTLEDVRGPQNLNRIRREILEKCNGLAWPKGRPLIDHVLFKEFTVQ